MLGMCTMLFSCGCTRIATVLLFLNVIECTKTC